MENNNQSHGFSNNPASQVILSLFFISLFWEFIIMLTLRVIHFQNQSLENIIDALALAILTAITFWAIYFRPRWRKDRRVQSFVQQQVTGLNQLAIVSATDRFGNITYVNDNFCTTTGFTKEELIGRTHRVIKSSYHSDAFFENLWGVITKGEIWQGDIKGRKKNGDEFWLHTNIIPLINEETKRIDEFLSIRFDITNEKNLKEQLETEQVKSIHMGRLAALGEMAGSIAHEVNNPIAIVLGKAHLLKRIIEKIENDDLKDSALKNLSTIDEQSKRIGRIVRGLKEFTHGGDDLNNYENVNSNQLIESVFELCAEKLKFNGIEIRRNIVETEFSSNKLQLEQVLVNLINNSIDAISDLEEKWMEISLYEKDNYIYFSVIDSGPGIPIENVDKIMQPFFTTKPVGKGTGLGLSISKGLIEKLGGEFKYDSASKNTKFTAKLPKNESVIFNSLNFEDAIINFDELKNRINGHLENISEGQLESYFILKETNSPLISWVNRFAPRLSKNDDYLDLKETCDEFTKIVSSNVNKIKNKSVQDKNEFSKMEDKMVEIINQLLEKLKALKSKYSING